MDLGSQTVQVGRCERQLKTQPLVPMEYVAKNLGVQNNVITNYIEVVFKMLSHR